MIRSAFISFDPKISPARRAMMLSSAIATLGLFPMLAQTATAQQVPAQPPAPTDQTRSQTIRFSIPAQNMNSALTRLADQGDIRIFFTSEDISGLRSRRLNGQMTVEQALSSLLRGSGYGWRYREARTVVIEKLPENARSARRLGTVKVEGVDTPIWNGGYSFGEESPADSGTSRIGRDTIIIRAPGSGDINRMLSILPTVQFSANQNIATTDSLQDIRPEKISISGGSVYENMFIVDGIGVNSRLDMFSDGDGDSYNPANFNNVVASSPQTFWVDSSLIGEVIVRDSNISAEYGQFTGGVVEIKTRNPGTEFGVEAYYGQTSDSLGDYKMSRNSRIALEGKDIPDTPDFVKRRYGAVVTLPVMEGFRLLGAYNYSSSSVTNYPGTNYVHFGAFQQKSVSENFMLKSEVDISPDILFRAQLTYSPYDSEFQTNNAIEGLLTSNGGGLTGSAGLEGTSGKANWKLEFTHAFSDNDRDGPGVTYNISTTGTGFDWCSAGSSCTIGGASSLNQRQYDTGIKGRWEQPLGPGTIRGGFEYSHIIGKKSRPEEANSYLSATVNANTVCEGDQGYACVDGAYALSRRMVYPAFDARAAINSYALWGGI